MYLEKYFSGLFLIYKMTLSFICLKFFCFFCTNSTKIDDSIISESLEAYINKVMLLSVNIYQL